MRGALASGRSVRDEKAATVPVVDAYESLRLAGLRPGARLCGTPVWWDGTSIFATRDGGAERLFSPGEPVVDLDARHGGANMQFHGVESASTREIHFEQGKWTEATPTWGSPRAGATYFSALSYSHNADSLVTAYVGLQGSAGVYIRTSGGTAYIGSVPAPTFVPGTWACGMRSGSYCVDSVLVGTSTIASVESAYSPMGDSVFVAVSSRSATVAMTQDWMPCLNTDGTPNKSGNYCRQFRESDETLGANVYAMDVHTGRRRLVKTFPKASVGDLGIAEGDREWMAALSEHSSESEISYVSPEIYDGIWWYPNNTTLTASTTNCRTEFLSMDGLELEKHSISGTCMSRMATVSGTPGPVVAAAAAAVPPLSVATPGH